MALKRYVPFILLNIVVSAAVVLGALYFWEQNQAEQQSIATATSAAATSPAATAQAVITASAPPQPTEEPQETSELVHVVQAGETLGTIAEQYDVPWEDIAEYNGVTDPNYLSVGAELVIPLGGLPTATVEPTAAPTSADPPTPIPTDPPAAGEAKVVIREVVGVGDLAEEAVVIANEGSRQIQLANWKLEDAQGNVYVFSPFILFGEGANLVLHSTAGTDTTFDLYWGLNFAVWESGEVVTLRDADGTGRATFTVP